MPAHTREPGVIRDTRPPLATQNDSGYAAIHPVCVVGLTSLGRARMAGPQRLPWMHKGWEASRRPHAP